VYKVPLPFTIGQEASGIIVKLPTASEVLESEAFKRRDLKIGDRVAAVRMR
jgi:NADPH2:quinone reductase